MKVRGLTEPVLCERISIQKVEWATKDFRHQKQEALERARHVEEDRW
jgi:hypothetical protein